MSVVTAEYSVPVWIAQSSTMCGVRQMHSACSEASESYAVHIPEVTRETTAINAADSDDLDEFRDTVVRTVEIVASDENASVESRLNDVCALCRSLEKMADQFGGAHSLDFLREVRESHGTSMTAGDFAQQLRTSIDRLSRLISTSERDGNPLISEASRFARNNCTGVTLEAAAQHVGVSSVHLSRLFKRVTGQNFIDYVMEARVSLARKLLRDPTVKVYEASERVGYGDPKYFAKVFKAVEGCTPTQYRLRQLSVPDQTDDQS